MSPPGLDLILVSHATRELLLGLLAEWAPRRDRFPGRVIVVDNASPDGSAAAVAEAHPWVELVANAENLGFAAAVNQGLARSQAAQVLVLNPDARVGEEALAAMAAHLAAHPEVGLVGPSLWGPEGARQPGALRDLWPWDLYAELARFPRGFQPHARRAWRRIVAVEGEAPLAVEAVMGAAMLISRACLDLVPRFDEAFFLYAEELDYCRRVRAAGLAVHHLPACRVQHVGGASASQWPSKTTAWRYASSLAYLRKHGGPWAAWQGRLALGMAGVQNALMARLLAWGQRLPPAELAALAEGARLMRVAAWCPRLPPGLAPPRGAGS